MSQQNISVTQLQYTSRQMVLVKCILRILRRKCSCTDLACTVLLFQLAQNISAFSFSLHSICFPFSIFLVSHFSHLYYFFLAGNQQTWVVCTTPERVSPARPSPTAARSPPGLSSPVTMSLSRFASLPRRFVYGVSERFGSSPTVVIDCHLRRTVKSGPPLRP